MEVFVNREDIQNIRSVLTQTIDADMLAPELLQLVYTRKWFNLYVPREFGGLGLGLPGAVQTLEQLAKADGSMGWTVTLCAGANWFIGFLPENIRSEFFSSPATCLSGSGAAGGTAEIEQQGYRVNGYWKYATGAPHATAFTANCYITRQGEYVTDENGSPLLRSFILKTEEVVIETNWHTMGMKATASHAFSAKQVYVPAERCFHIEAGSALLPDLIFYFPFQTFAEVTMAANFSGMAQHWLSCCRALFERKSDAGYNLSPSSALTDALQQAAQLQGKARNAFVNKLHSVWEKGIAKRAWPQAELDVLSKLSHHLVVSSVNTVQQLYPLCGMEAATLHTALNRIWLDIHTARQHVIFRFSEADESLYQP